MKMDDEGETVLPLDRPNEEKPKGSKVKEIAGKGGKIVNSFVKGASIPNKGRNGKKNVMKTSGGGK